MVHHVDVFYQVRYEAVKADIVQQYHKEGVQGADRVIRLLLCDVNFIVAHHEEGLGKLDVVNKANKLIFAVSEDTSPIDDREARETKLSEEGNDCHCHQIYTDLEMVALNMLQLLGEFCLLLHVTSFFFASSVSHFLANIIDTVLAKRIIILKKVDGILTIAVFISVASSSRSSFIWILRAGSVMAVS